MTDREPMELAVETPYSRAFAAGRRAGMEEAAKICEGEISGATEDASRDAALSHCIRQIRAAMEADHG
jgi:hypothetical protein